MLDDDQVQRPAPSPMLLAWKSYQRSSSFVNAKRWAEQVVFSPIENHVGAEINHPHLEEFLWNAFINGWQAAKQETMKFEAHSFPIR
jgi:hypothetical protein